MKSTEYEIWVDKDIKRASSIEEVVQMTIAQKIKSIIYIEKGDKKMLMNFLMTTATKIDRRGKQIVRRTITEVIFTEVEKYERMIVYDHFKNFCIYTSKDDIKTYETTSRTPVFKFPSKVEETVAETIIRNQ